MRKKIEIFVLKLTIRVNFERLNSILTSKSLFKPHQLLIHVLALMFGAAWLE